MALSTNLISGLSSGFDWRSMIDQLMAIEHRRVDLVENQKTDYESKLEIFQSVNTKLLSFRSQAETLANSDAFNLYTTSLSTDSSTYNASDFLSVSTTTSAAPGSHTITMNANSQVAQARQISSKSFSSYNKALSLSGEFVINGRTVEVDTSDDLADIRNKINNLNTGSNATGITASILTVSSNNYRLVMTSDDTGEDAFTIFDASADAENILSTGLGFTDGTTSVKNYVSNGFQSEAFSSSTQAVGSMLGISDAQSGTVTIGGVGNIDINLTTDSLTDIAAEINAESGGSVTASVASTTENGVTTYRLKIENTTSYTDDEHVLETLGLIQGDQGTVSEVHLGSEVLYADAGQASYITGATAWNSVYDSGGTGAGVANGDVILIKGKKNDGTAVDTSFTISDNTWTIDEAGNSFLEAIESAFDLEADSVTIVDGQIQVSDSTPGDSQLSIQLISQNQGGGTLDLGTFSATTEGYTMEVQSGQDAKVIIDGTAITSSSNVIDGVISGVTLNLMTMEADTTVNLTVSRDYETIKSSVQDLLDAYNDVMADINEQFAYDEDTQTGGLLQGDGTLHSVKSDLVDIVVGAITGLPSSLNALSLIGITSDDDGNLSIDEDDFKEAFNDNFNGLKRIFIAEGSTTDGDVEYVGHTNDTVGGVAFAVNITQAATQAQVTGTEDLSGGIASDLSTITVTQGSKTAAVTLDSSDSGSSIDDIVNAINSEFEAQYAQTLMGNKKNTLSDGTTAITSTTKWNAVYSGGSAANLVTGDEITFTGSKRNGTSVSGTYEISDAATDTVQGLLSAIEAAYDYEVSAGIDTNGYLIITDNSTGNSQLSISFDMTDAHDLDFGEVTTSNLVSSVRNTTDGSTAILGTTKWDEILGSTVTTDDTFTFSGYTADGNAVEGSYTVANVLTDNVDDLLMAIKTAYDAAGGSITAEIQDGRIMIKDGTTNSTLGIEILEPSGKGIDFGTLSGGVTGRYSMDMVASKDGSNQLVLTHDEYGSSQSFTVQVSDSDLGITDNQAHSGLDVEGTINGESATGSGQLLTGDAPGSGETTSVQGLSIKYTGTTTGSQGDVKITMGVGELFYRALYDITNLSNGYLYYKIQSVSDSIDDFGDQIEDMEARLDLKMEGMINRFVVMETALSKIQSQSQWLSGQLQSAYSGWV